MSDYYERKNSNFNKDITKIKAKNFYTPPVNQPRWTNPFLLESKNEVLNRLLKHKDVLFKLSGKHIGNTTGLQPTPVNRRSTNPLIPTAIPGTLTNQQYASIVQNEAYKYKDERRDIAGFTLLNDPSTDNIIAYKSNDSKRILLGVAGTHDWDDLATDAQLAGKMERPLYSERFKELQKAYEKIRSQYPSAKIIVGGHSLGNSIVLELLRNNLNDNNLEAYGYNGWLNPLYTGKDDNRYHEINVKDDMVSSIKHWIQDEVSFVERTIDNPVKLDKAKKALYLVAGSTMGAIGMNYKFRKQDVSDNEITLNALNDVQADYEFRMKDVGDEQDMTDELNPEDTFEGHGGLVQQDWDELEGQFYSRIKGVPIRYRNGVREYLMPLEDDLDVSEVAEDVNPNDEWWTFKEIMKTNRAEEGEVGVFSEALGEGMVDRAVKAEESLTKGLGTTTAVALAPWVTLHHDARNFIDKETRQHIGKERTGEDKWKDMGKKVGEGGVAYGVYRGVKSEASKRVYKYTGIDKLPKYVKNSAERLKRNITEGLKDYVNRIRGMGGQDIAFDITEEVGLATFL